MTAALVAIAMMQTAGISGSVPAGVGVLEPPGDVVWLPAHSSLDESEHHCELISAARWACPTVGPGHSGVVLIRRENGIGYVVIGPAGIVLSGGASWGRLVQVGGGVDT